MAIIFCQRSKNMNITSCIGLHWWSVNVNKDVYNVCWTFRCATVGVLITFILNSPQCSFLIGYTPQQAAHITISQILDWSGPNVHPSKPDHSYRMAGISPKIVLQAVSIIGASVSLSDGKIRKKIVIKILPCELGISSFWNPHTCLLDSNNHVSPWLPMHKYIEILHCGWFAISFTCLWFSSFFFYPRNWMYLLNKVFCKDCRVKERKEIPFCASKQNISRGFIMQKMYILHVFVLPCLETAHNVLFFWE